MRTLIIPGWRNSGPGHWQSLWEARLPDVTRVQQDDWVAPRRAAWLENTVRAILARPDPVLLVAHSLGCIVVAHLPPEAQARVHGALLVAPADPERRAVLVDFAPVPHARLPFRSTLVASTNDPYCPVRLAGAYARAWGSQLVRLPDAGHINVDSGHGEWPQGLELLRALEQAPPRPAEQPTPRLRRATLALAAR
ncbi:alpha/beta hydrolase [Pseudorhodoferax aquiterrae]|uniref:Alpha/beta hydrolase n=1 Tax=Pseudorhodoferax aquiterrae TaxID=747304 RepID=A0ABQ3G7C6_9BURK|nr:alpha/beta hydrolase [Pseudorhodoferax aquiterrae]GHC93278.1 alpha/beta hydrolase [Pseudorhodoferax aquiterrae]